MQPKYGWIDGDMAYFGEAFQASEHIQHDEILLLRPMRYQKKFDDIIAR